MKSDHSVLHVMGNMRSTASLLSGSHPHQCFPAPVQKAPAVIASIPRRSASFESAAQGKSASLEMISGARVRRLSRSLGARWEA